MRLSTKQKRSKWLVAPYPAINQAKSPIHGVEDEVVLDGVADVWGHAAIIRTRPIWRNRISLVCSYAATRPKATPISSMESMQSM